jgi:ABC-type uncharacterized transport system ATPase subunit
VRAEEVASAVGRLLAAHAVADLNVVDPPLEEVMKALFDRSRSEREAAGG